MILCDALTYAQRFEPAALVDVATLTGACMVALGHQTAGLMSKRRPGQRAAGRKRRTCSTAPGACRCGTSTSRCWIRPSPTSTTSAAAAGAITAGCFLSRFTEGQRWAHLDIAGVASCMDQVARA